MRIGFEKKNNKGVLSYHIYSIFFGTDFQIIFGKIKNNVEKSKFDQSQVQICKHLES